MNRKRTQERPVPLVQPMQILPHEIRDAVTSARQQIQPMDPAWRDRLDERTRDLLRQAPHMNALRERLLTLAGHEAVLPVAEEDLALLLTRGRVWEATGEVLEGAPSQCHRNVARLVDDNRQRYAAVTGYALSEDGVWRQHSWLYDRRAVHVVDTTEPRILYFGAALQGQKLEDFISDNWI